MSIAILLHRDKIGNRFRRDNNTSGMGGSVSNQTFNAHADIQQALRFRIILIHLFESMVMIQKVAKGNARACRDALADVVDQSRCSTDCFAHISNGALGGQLAESDDTSNMICTVHLNNVSNDFLSAFRRYVNINIRHCDTLWVQETLENQTEAAWLDIRNTHAVCNNRAGRTAASRTDRNTVTLCIGNDVGYNQKVIYEAHGFDYIHFVFQLCKMLISRAFVAFFQSCFTQCSEEDCIACYAVRQRELGEMVLTLLQGDVALISNHLSILNSFRSKCIKDRMHFFLALHVPVIRIAIANSCFVINGGFHIHHH